MTETRIIDTHQYPDRTQTTHMKFRVQLVKIIDLSVLVGLMSSACIAGTCKAEANLPPMVIMGPHDIHKKSLAHVASPNTARNICEIKVMETDSHNDVYVVESLEARRLLSTSIELSPLVLRLFYPSVALRSVESSALATSQAPAKSPALPPVPAAASSVVATAVSTESIELTWLDNSSNEAGFTILRKLGSGPYQPVITTDANATSFTDTGLTPDTQYDYEVVATNVGGAAPPSNTTTGKTPPPPAVAPTLSSAIAFSAARIDLNWKDNSNNEDRFLVEESTDGETYSTIATLAANTTSYSVTGLSPNTPYTFRIFAKNANGISASNPLSVTTKQNVTVDGDGWTTIVPSADSRMIYVSSSTGSDSNSGLSADQAVATIAKGYSLLRDGYPDWLLLKSGDSWDAPLGKFIKTGIARFGLSGRSSTEPMVITTYGSGPRPILRTGSADSGLGATGGVSRSHLAVIGLDFEGSGAGTGVWISEPGSDYLVEDCVVSGYYDDVTVMTDSTHPLSDVRLRRNIILDAWSSGGHPQGLFAYDVDRLLLEENLFDHNGWKEGVLAPTIFNHDAYTKNTTNLIVRGNVFANASSFGLTVSGTTTGGVVNPLIENNLFIGDGNALTFGSGAKFAITGAVVQGNVFTEIGRTINGVDQSIGVDVGSADGVQIKNNLFLNKPAAGTSFIVSLGSSLGYNNISIDNNIMYNWKKGYINIASSTLSNIEVKGNILQDHLYGSVLEHFSSTLAPTQVQFANNTYFSNAPAGSWFNLNNVNESFEQWTAASGEVGATTSSVNFADPSRTVETYAASIGQAATADALITAMRNRSRTSWQSQYSADCIVKYLWSGFAPQ